MDKLIYSKQITQSPTLRIMGPSKGMNLFLRGPPNIRKNIASFEVPGILRVNQIQVIDVSSGGFYWALLLTKSTSTFFVDSNHQEFQVPKNGRVSWTL